MKKATLKMMIRICSILTSFAVLTVFSFPSSAEDSIETLENTTSDLQNELSDLNSELSALSSDLDSIIKQISTTTEEIEQTKITLADAKEKEQKQYNSMKRRIKQIYESGNKSYIEILFSSHSMAEFLNKAEFISAISEYDHKCLEELVESKKTVADKEKQLQEKKEKLIALKSDLDKKEQTLQSKISNTSGELGKYSAKLNKAKEEFKKAQEALNHEAKPKPKPTPPPKEPPKENPSTGTDSNDNNHDTGSKPPVNANATELELFAALIECEAGSTNYEGMLAVASVVINRVNHRYYPDTITGVIYQSGQFSPIASGKVDKVLKRGIKSSCLQAAKDAIAGKNNIGDCLSFRAVGSGHSGIVIGGNVFF